MHPFEHHSPRSLSEAVTLLAEADGSSRIIAGGTDLLLKMKDGVLKPTALIDIKRVPELKGLSYDARRGLRLGALTTLREVTRSEAVRAHYPALAEAAYLMASEQIRSFATVGGNLCNAAPSADLAPPLIALDAEALLSAADSERTLPLAQFFLGPGQTALQPGELLREIRVPPPTGRTTYLKHAARAFMDIAVVGVALRLVVANERCQSARIALGAVAPVPLRARDAEAFITGRSLTAGNIDRTAELAAAACSPIDDVRSSGWYRRRMVGVLTRRGLHALNEADS